MSVTPIEARPALRWQDQSADYRDVLAKRAKKEVERLSKLAKGVHPRHCPICSYHGRFTPFGVPPRLDAQCAGCGSLERHRQFALCHFDTGLLHSEAKVLHFAPEAQLRKFIKSRVATYETAELSDSFTVTHYVDIEDTGLPDAAYDLIVCNHVLEHVDDAKALSEFLRILKPGGVAIVSFPICEGWEKTYENPEITTRPLRKLHFGQGDHIRLFGRDVRARIREAGFDLTEYTAVEPDVLTYGLMRGETLFVAKKPAKKA